MTFEEFKKELKLQYTFGMNGETGASRRYHDSNMNIGSELHTPKKDGVWGEGERTFYIETSEKLHDSLESLYDEWKGLQK
jgi:hypothetical protein